MYCITLTEKYASGTTVRFTYKTNYFNINGKKRLEPTAVKLCKEQAITSFIILITLSQPNLPSQHWPSMYSSYLQCWYML